MSRRTPGWTQGGIFAAVHERRGPSPFFPLAIHVLLAVPSSPRRRRTLAPVAPQLDLPPPLLDSASPLIDSDLQLLDLPLPQFHLTQPLHDSDPAARVSPELLDSAWLLMDSDPQVLYWSGCYFYVCSSRQVSSFVVSVLVSSAIHLTNIEFSFAICFGEMAVDARFGYGRMNTRSIW